MNGTKSYYAGNKLLYLQPIDFAAGFCQEILSNEL